MGWITRNLPLGRRGCELDQSLRYLARHLKGAAVATVQCDYPHRCLASCKKPASPGVRAQWIVLTPHSQKRHLDLWGMVRQVVVAISHKPYPCTRTAIMADKQGEGFGAHSPGLGNHRPEQQCQKVARLF